MVTHGLRQFHRNRDGIQIQLRLDEWPADVPLPSGSAIIGIGENRELLIYPQWRFVLESDCTIEVVTGIFSVAFSFEATLSWYRATLPKLGWAEDTTEGYQLDNTAGLVFQHPETNVRVRLSLRSRETLGDTRATIWRVTKHSWSPPTELTAEAQESSLSGEEKTIQ